MLHIILGSKKGTVWYIFLHHQQSSVNMKGTNNDILKWQRLDASEEIVDWC